jgi:hypothetical protein
MTAEEHQANDRHWREAIANCLPLVFEATNVNEYFYNGTDQEFWQPDRDFPCMAPPGYMSWFEYSRPQGVNTTVKGWQDRFDVQRNLPWKTGALVMLVDPKAGPDHARYFEKKKAEHQQQASLWQNITRPCRDLSQARCFLQIVIFICLREDEPAIGPLGEFYVYLDQNFDCFEYLMYTLVANGAQCPWPEGGATGLDNMVYPAMLALTMMNLKNVSVTSVKPDEGKKEKHRAIYRERHGRDKVLYKTLEITPVASLTRLEMEKAPPQGSGRHVRSHVYRGYVLRSGVDGRKHLFGNSKIVGRFWVAPGKRGGKDTGEVVKDYKFGEVK